MGQCVQGLLAHMVVVQPCAHKAGHDAQQQPQQQADRCFHSQRNAAMQTPPPQGQHTSQDRGINARRPPQLAQYQPGQSEEGCAMVPAGNGLAQSFETLEMLLVIRCADRPHAQAVEVRHDARFR